MGFEDPDKPQSLERLITALGGEVADYEAKSKCCGFPIILARDRGGPEGVAPSRSRSRATPAPTAWSRPCPLCHLAMDAYQRKAEAANATEYNMPVLHLPQLIGLALGHRHRDHGLQAPPGAGRPRAGDRRSVIRPPVRPAPAAPGSRGETDTALSQITPLTAGTRSTLPARA